MPNGSTGIRSRSQSESTSLSRLFLSCLLLVLALPAGYHPPLQAQEDDALQRGDLLFKKGLYRKASEEYRVAALADQVDPWKKISFGHSLFAIGNYSYSAYALRRGISGLPGTLDFQVNVVERFPSQRSFRKALRDLKRYVTYAPRDPSGLSVLGYMYYCSGSDSEAREIFGVLQRLDEQDPFARFFLDLLNPPEPTDPPDFPEQEADPLTPTATPGAPQAAAPESAGEGGPGDELPAGQLPQPGTLNADLGNSPSGLRAQETTVLKVAPPRSALSR